MTLSTDELVQFMSNILKYEYFIYKKIFDYVFIPCSDKSEITKDVKYIRVIPDKHTKKVKTDAFFACVNIEMVILDKSVETLGYSAFDRCTNLKYIQINENLKHIGILAFYRCKSLEYVVLNKNLITIDGILNVKTYYLSTQQNVRN